MPLATGESQEDPDLAVLDPLGGARVLALHAGRLNALLEGPGLVDDKHALGVGHVLARIGRGRRRPGRRPSPRAEQVLDALGGLVASLLRELPGVLTLAEEEAADVLDCPSPGLGAGESAC